MTEESMDPQHDGHQDQKLKHETLPFKDRKEALIKAQPPVRETMPSED
jgi:hypothetical protein